MAKMTKISIRKINGGWNVSISNAKLSASALVPEGEGVEAWIEAVLGGSPKAQAPPPPEPEV
jgi:hypothetical protein